MDVILHIGAHRTGTTSFQSYLRSNRAVLDGLDIGFWGPWRTRNGLLDGLTARPATPKHAARIAGRVRMNLAKTRSAGKDQLIVSDENLIGTCRGSLRAGRLYPDIGERMARVNAGFGQISRIHFQIRSLDIWWASALAFLIPRGHAVPSNEILDRLTNSPRSWRHVITDIACACPDAQILVTPFERFSGAPDRLFAQISQLPAVPTAQEEHWKNRSPDAAELRAHLAERDEDPVKITGEGRWIPFADAQSARLRETYADDLFWLRAGADGLAKLTEDTGPNDTGNNLGGGLQTRGQRDDGSARRLAPTR